MSTYAVLWSEEGCDVLVGKLELAVEGLSFGGRRQHDVAYADIDAVHVARRAADRVGLPKSTVSRRVAELEKRLGERLLQRSTRKLAVTEFGIFELRREPRASSKKPYGCC